MGAKEGGSGGEEKGMKEGWKGDMRDGRRDNFVFLHPNSS
jgi:hypothetical protein